MKQGVPTRGPLCCFYPVACSIVSMTDSGWSPRWQYTVYFKQKINSEFWLYLRCQTSDHESKLNQDTIGKAQKPIIFLS